MATHSGVLAWRISGTGRLVGCRLWGRTESDTTETTQQQQQQHLNQKILSKADCQLQCRWASFNPLKALIGKTSTLRNKEFSLQINFRIKTETSALPSLSHLLVCATGFELASPYSSMNQLLKIKLFFFFLYACSIGSISLKILD